MSWLYVAAAAAAVVGGIGANNANQQRKVAAQNASTAAAYNAALTKQRSDQTLTTFNLREEQKRRANRLESGKRAAAIAQNGTGAGGSNLAFAEQQGLFEEMDALNIRYEGQLEANGLLAQSSLDSWDSENANQVAHVTSQNAFMDTASGALAGASSVYRLGSH
jgi:hypothetical protein